MGSVSPGGVYLQWTVPAAQLMRRSAAVSLTSPYAPETLDQDMRTLDIMRTVHRWGQGSLSHALLDLTGPDIMQGETKNVPGRTVSATPIQPSYEREPTS